jgi:diguanylate cyclase (GGDEF)-like protein
LSSANAAIRRELEKTATSRAIDVALQASDDVQIRVQNACDRLRVVNDELHGQLRDRVLLEHQFAAVVEQEEAARHSALHDALTDLPNRALFSDRLEHGLAQAKRHGWRLAVLFMDLDRFKTINDQHGHHAGDCLLQIVAQRLMGNIREEDTVSRYGGDEFVYVLNDIQDEKSVTAMVAKIIEKVEAPYEVGVHGVNVVLSVKASIGIAIFPKDGTMPDSLVKSADAAMYRAKQSGSRYAFY